MLATEAPKVTDWMQAWGNIASAVLSAIAVLVTGLLLVLELRRWRQERAETEARQARLVWAEPKGSAVDDHGSYRGQVVTIHNASSDPIYNVLIKADFYAGPEMERSSWMVVSDPSIQSGNSSREFITYSPRMPRPMTEDEVMERYGPPDIEIQFTDSSGTQWRRFKLQSPRRARDEDLTLDQISRSTPALVADYLRIPRIIRYPRAFISIRINRLHRKLRSKLAAKLESRPPEPF